MHVSPPARGLSPLAMSGDPFTGAAVVIPFDAPGPVPSGSFEQALSAASAAASASNAPTTAPGVPAYGSASAATTWGAAPAASGSVTGGTSVAGTPAAMSIGQAPTAGGTIALQMPVAGSPPLTQPFGPTPFLAEPSYDGYAHFHTGIDLGVPLGTPVDAAGAGRVTAAGWDSSGFGIRVIVDHGNGVSTLYGHLESTTVQPGDVVQAGQEIGLSGTTGNSTGPHLHFGVEQNGRWVDPMGYLNASAGAPSLPSVIGRASEATGVPDSLLSAVVQAESGGNPNAVSPAGAKGLMQLMDATAATYGVTNPFDPTQNVTAGATYLQSLLTRFHGDERLAVAAYNAGPGAVEQYGGVPPFPETQSYVQRVMALQQHYAAQTGP